MRDESAAPRRVERCGLGLVGPQGFEPWTDGSKVGHALSANPSLLSDSALAPSFAPFSTNPSLDFGPFHRLFRGKFANSDLLLSATDRSPADATLSRVRRPCKSHGLPALRGAGATTAAAGGPTPGWVPQDTDEEESSEEASREEGCSKETRGQEGGEEVTSAKRRTVDPARIRNAWAGRVSGCQLGKAVEGCPSFGATGN